LEAPTGSIFFGRGTLFLKNGAKMVDEGKKNLPHRCDTEDWEMIELLLITA